MDSTTYGALCLLPAVFIIIFAIKSKRTFEALFFGSVIAFIMYYGKGFFTPLVDEIQEAIAGEIWIFVAFCLFGFFVQLLQQSQGTIGFANWLQKYATSQKKALVATWALGLVVFLDDFLNILTVSAAMKDTLDRHKTPREMLAYVLDSTGAPVCVLIPLSTWAIFYADLAGGEMEAAGWTELSSGMSMYIHAIPFMLYSWIAVIMVPLVGAGIVPKLGAMKKAYQRVETTGKLWSDASDRFNKSGEEYEAPDGIKPNMWDFIIPLVVVVVAMFITEDMVSSLLIVLVVMFLLYMPRKRMSFEDFFEALPRGIITMLPVIIILVGCYMIRDAMNLIQMPQWVVQAVLPFCSPTLLPGIAFVVVAVLSFVTGSSWGVPAITVPFLMPLAFQSGSDPVMVLGAIVCGASFGSHACFYADATVLSSSAAKCDNLDHALSQLPYVLISAGLAEVLFIILGIIMI